MQSGKQSGGGNLSGYYLNRLKEGDLELFRWKAKDHPIPLLSYAQKCTPNLQGDAGQPVSVTDAELEYINKSKDLGSGKKSYTNVMKFGNKQLNYICPEYWDTENNISLDKNNPKWDRNQVVGVNDVAKNTDKTILQRVGKAWHNNDKSKADRYGNYPNIKPPLPEIRAIENYKNPINGLDIPCCYPNIKKDINVESGAISTSKICYKNYCLLNDRLNIYFDQVDKKDNIFLKKGIKSHTLLDCIIQILNDENVIDLKDFNKLMIEKDVDDKKSLKFINKNEIKSKIVYIEDFIDIKKIQEDIIEYIKNKIKNPEIKIYVLYSKLFISYCEQKLGKKLDIHVKNILRKCINVEKENIEKVYSICEFIRKNVKIKGLIEYDTKISYRICCQSKKEYFEKSSLYIVSQTDPTLKKTDYSCSEYLKDYDVNKDNITDIIKNIKKIVINIDDIYNKYVNIFKNSIFVNILTKYIRKENRKHFIESGNGMLVEIFKKDKSKINDKDVENFIKDFSEDFPKYNKYDTKDKLYDGFKGDMEMFLYFNAYISSENYIDYLEDENQFKDDMYILPIVKSYIEDDILVDKTAVFVVFEYVNGDIRIKNGYDIDEKDGNRKEKGYFFLYKTVNYYEPICFKDGKKDDVYFFSGKKYNKQLELIKKDIIENEDTTNILDYYSVIKKFKINRVYIHNNKMTHCITEDDYFIPIKPCFIKNSGLKFIYDIKRIKKHTYEDYRTFYNKKFLKNIYIFYQYVVNKGKILNIVFQNKSYIPVEHKNKKVLEKDIYGYNELFELDKNIVLKDVTEDSNYKNTDDIQILLNKLDKFIQLMLVYFKNENKRYENVQEINKYKTNNNPDGIDTYKNNKIIKIVSNKIENTGTIYTYSNILEKIDNILKNDIILKIHKIIDLYEILKPISEKVIKKLPELDTDDGTGMQERYLKRFIELLLIYGIDKNDATNIYNSGDKIELHTLKNTVKENETFIPYMDNIEEYLDHLFDTNKYITI